MSPHLENARELAVAKLRRPKTGGGVSGWLIRQAIRFLRRKLRKSNDAFEACKIAELLILIMEYLRQAPWVKVKYHQWIEEATKSLTNLKEAICG